MAAKPSARGALTWVGTDSNIYYCDGDCAKPRCLSCAVAGTQVRRDGGGVRTVAMRVQDEPGGTPPPRIRYGWPTFAPDGKRIAYSSITARKSGNEFAIWIYDIARHDAQSIFQSRAERVVYIYWLDDNQHISFLVTEPQGLSLMLAEIKEGAPIRIVASGSPVYFDWSAAPDRLAIHTAGADRDVSERVTLMSLTPTSQQVVKVLSHGRSPFKAPCWSPDGKHLAWIANYHAEANLVVADADGEHPRSVVSLPIGDNCFVWSPDSKHIAYSTTVIPRDPTMHGIKLVDIADATSRTLSKEDVSAFFFSPDGRYLAAVAVPSDKPYYVWKVIDVKTGANRNLGRFLSTEEEAVTYHYFDQLVLSHTIWSPDSKAIVFAGVRLLVEPNQSLGEAPPPSVWIVPVNGAEPRSVGKGVVAFYSPAGAP